MKKKIDISSVASSLRGESVFFPMKEGKPAPEKAGEPIENNTVASIQADQPISNEAHQQESKPTNMQSSNQTSMRASIVASKHASTLATPPDIIEIIRKIVKTPAKEEVLYVRVTKEEKNRLGDIEYTYGRQDVETSANELGRIAINFLIADHKANGEKSILAQVLAALRA